jgi:hypothetical protein
LADFQSACRQQPSLLTLLRSVPATQSRTPDGVPRSPAYHAQLQQMLRSGGCSASVMHAAIAGNTTGQMLKRRHGVVKPSTRVLNL